MPRRPTEPVGLYDPSYEHDACGVAFVARLDGEPTPRDRRSARSSRSRTSSTAAPRAPTRTPATAPGSCSRCPTSSSAAVIDDDAAAARAPTASRVCFLPAGRRAPRRARGAARASTVEAEGQRVVGWRDVPVDKDYVGITANLLRALHQAARRRRVATSWRGDQDAFERKLYVIRRVAELAAGPDLVIPSFSSRTIVYKGMLTAPAAARLLPRPAGRADARPRSRSSTRASRPTRSRAGSSRTRTG